MKSCVIIPTFNEAENIAELKRRLPNDVEVLVVDDSPTKETAKAAQAAGCLVFWRRGKGLSSAVVDGLKMCDAEAVVVMDADLQHPPELVPELLKQLDTHDLVVASRRSAKGWSVKRKLISLVANMLALPLVPKIKDRTSGFFGFKRSIVNPTSLSSTGWKIMLEIAVRGHPNGIAEVPYDFGIRTKGESKLTQKVMFEYLKQLVSLYLYKFRILRFAIVGGVGTLVNLTTLFLVEHFVLHSAFESAWGTAAASRAYLVAFIPAFLLAVVCNFVLNNRWTFKERSAGKVGFGKYTLMASATLPLDYLILFALTEFLGLFYVVSAFIAILAVFIIRYTASNKLIWRKSAST